jgi:hypothetical protein
LATDGVIVAKTGTGLTSIVSPLATAVMVDRKSKELSTKSIDDILKADKHNYFIPNSEINEVILKKKLGSIKIRINSKNKQVEWTAMGFSATKPNGEKQDLKHRIEDYEITLRPIFGEKLIKN